MEITVKKSKKPPLPETLLEYLLSKKVKIDHECGGMGICGTCRVKVLEGEEQLPELGEFERLRLENFAIEASERLSCQIPPIEGLRIKVP